MFYQLNVRLPLTNTLPGASCETFHGLIPLLSLVKEGCFEELLANGLVDAPEHPFPYLCKNQPTEEASLRIHSKAAIALHKKRSTFSRTDIKNCEEPTSPSGPSYPCSMETA
jgi:hypothetical protein